MVSNSAENEEKNNESAQPHLKSWQRVSLILIALVAVLVLSWVIYVNIYYKADEVALNFMQGNENVAVTEIKNGWFFDGPGNEKALIFYPGAKVESKAYAPLLSQLAEEGVDCFLIDMPSRMAFLGTNRADNVLKEYAYDEWYLAGHSLGGAIVAFYASDHMERFDGVILLAAYPMKDLKAENFKALSIYGSEDHVLNRRFYDSGQKYVPQDYTELCIAGGNHAQFGSYGKQWRDGEASIDGEEQRKEAEQAILSFIKGE